MNHIESYISRNFITGDNVFTNLLIAIPIIATILLMYFNCLRSKPAEHAIDSVNDCKFISLTLIVYVPTFLIFTNLFGYQLSVCTIFIMILGYIPFVFLSSCICKEFCLQDGNQKLGGDNNSYTGAFTKKIKLRIQQIRDAKKTRNILINGSWGAGKSHFIEKHIIPTQSLIYISCTDYADTHELISALITKTNNCVFRWLFRLSISRLLAVLGKYELKEFIGVNKVIVFDEFERLVDYNKIDPMHIVSLIQYLNNQKDCICILVANEDHLNNASQFNNVREKLISYIYRYKVPLDEVIAIIQAEYLEDAKMHFKEKVEIIDLDDSNFGKLREDFERRYETDNNIRMMKHLYFKINQIYAIHKNFDEFANIVSIKKDTFFALLFDNVLDLINPLYYLYLKNPYNLKVIEALAVVYRNMKDKPKKEPDKEKREEQGSSSDNTLKLESYLDKGSIQKLALEYLNENIISYENDGNEFYDVSYDLNYIITNRNFENINAKLITEFLGNEQIVIQLMSSNGGYGKPLSQNIKIFMRSFKETFCEDDNSVLIGNYFKRINVLEQRFVRLIDDTELPWDYSIVTDYIKYCQYLKEKREKRGKNHLSPKFLSVSYNKVAYTNALIIQMILESGKVTIEQIVSEINNFNKPNELPSVLYERTCLEIINENKTSELIELIKAIADKLNKQKYQQTILNEFIYSSYFEIQRVAMLYKYSSNEADKNDFITLIEQMVNKLKESQQTPIKILQFMAKPYQDIKNHLQEPEIKKCNENLIDLLTIQNKSKDFMMHLFVELSDFNTNDGVSENFPDSSLTYLVDKIKAVFYTQESLNAAIAYIKQSINGQIAKDVVAKLKKDLDKQNNQKTE